MTCFGMLGVYRLGVENQKESHMEIEMEVR